MLINHENYHSKEMNQKYFSNSQVKNFFECPAQAMAYLNETYARETTTDMKIGSYVDAHFSGQMALFRANNKDIFLKNGYELKSNFAKADEIVARIERDAKMKKYLAGDSQVIKTGEIEGVPFKVMFDSYHQGKVIVDLKVMRDFKMYWKNGIKMNFIEFYGYDYQAAIYQEIEGNKLPFFIAAATKEKEPDLAIIEINQNRLDMCLAKVKQNIKHFNDIKEGREEPTRCGKCNYCKSTKESTLMKFTDFDEYIFNNVG